MLKYVYRMLILALMVESSSSENVTPDTGASKKTLELAIKDDGLVDIKAGDVLLVFYLTAANTGSESYHLNVKSEKCCQKLTADDEDCEMEKAADLSEFDKGHTVMARRLTQSISETARLAGCSWSAVSMVLLGGNMGELFPQDTRNLTLIFPNLYLHDRAGECDVEISSKAGGKMIHKVKFNTTIPRSSDIRPTRLLEQYYDPEDVQNCDSVDKDPLNECKPVTCYIKYNGFRNFYNHSSQRCENLTQCKSEKNEELPDTAYVSVSNQCRKIGEKTLTAEDEASFKHGVPGPSLHHMHTYPLNVDCYNGKKDESSGWCICDDGWKSAEIDHATFNPDVQVYHMCTVWTGELTAAEAANITHYPKENNITNYVIFSTLLTVFVLLFIIIGICLYRQKIKTKENQSTYELLPTEEASQMEVVNEQEAKEVSED